LGTPFHTTRLYAMRIQLLLAGMISGFRPYNMQVYASINDNLCRVATEFNSYMYLFIKRIYLNW